MILCNLDNTLHGNKDIDTFFISHLNWGMICFLQMDDNLRKSPQHPPRKLTTLKLSTTGEGNSSVNRLSPWEFSCLFLCVCVLMSVSPWSSHKFCVYMKLQRLLNWSAVAIAFVWSMHSVFKKWRKSILTTGRLIKQCTLVYEATLNAA